ncbi:MAG: alkaline phosphatase family protein [Pirellulaceae bacterium]|nr:alkaline phosphatase family protein [Pirellulaceae bacterium]
MENDLVTCPLFLLSIPGLREEDLAKMPNLSALVEKGDQATLVPSFPAVTWPVQANMLTGKLPSEHGVVANGFFWRDENRVEMWTANNEKVLAPQIWDILKRSRPDIKSAVWFPMLSKGCQAEYVCMPAPIHNRDGSESLWCYTKPYELYGDLKEELDHFPLQHFWGPLANSKSSQWIADSAVLAAEKYKPQFFYIYLTHLDYAAQKNGPDSPQADQAITEMDTIIGDLIAGMKRVYGDKSLVWIVASEYTIVPVDHVTYPNKVLRKEGLLSVEIIDKKEHLDFENSAAWAMVDHQFSHVFVKNSDPQVIKKVIRAFENIEGIEEILDKSAQTRYGVSHENSGDLVLISTKNSWQAYYWWLESDDAPDFAHSVDIHRKPGYDPVELHFDPKTRSIPLDATLVKGSHGAPSVSPMQQGICVTSKAGVLQGKVIADTDIATAVLAQFGVKEC